AADREGIAVVVVGRVGAACPALSQVGDDLWAATVGAGTLDRAPSVLDHERWRRARPYLLTAPVAIAQQRDDQNAIAAGQIEPPSAWLAIYAHDAARVEGLARAFALL